MRARQTVLATIIPMDIELGEAVHALELLEPVKRHFRSTGNKLQQLGTLFLIKGSNRTPEPLNFPDCYPFEDMY